jgi:hypothetical protein
MRIVIHVNGGLVQSVWCEQPAVVVIVNTDDDDERDQREADANAIDAASDGLIEVY